MVKKGRPSKKDTIDLSQVEVAGELGLTDVEICKFFNISKQTLNTYKKTYPAFLDSLKKGKEQADDKVVASLYKRATGYSHPDIHITSYQGAVTITPIIKYYPPDPFSIVYWLNNRRPDQWKNRKEESNSLTNEELNALREMIYNETTNNI